MSSISYIKYLNLITLEKQVEIDLIKIARVCNWFILTTYTDL